MASVQQVLDIFGYIHPARLGYPWYFISAAGLGLVAGIAFSYEVREKFRPWLLGTLAAILAFVLEFVYRHWIFSVQEPPNYDGSFLQFAELAASFGIFSLIGVTFEVILGTALGSLLGKLIGK